LRIGLRLASLSWSREYGQAYRQEYPARSQSMRAGSR
jgi:hypothetical protein